MFEKVGIVILNYNSAIETVSCINSILYHTKKYPFYIYVIDNKSTDNSMDILMKKYEDNHYINIVVADRNGGYSYGNNLGIYSAIQDGCDYIVISNPDIVLKNDAISLCVDALIDNPDVGITGPLLLQNDGQGQIARKPITFISSMLNKSIVKKITFMKGESLRNFSWDNKSNYKFEGIVAGCFIVTSSKLIRNIGAFDEDFFLYNEEDVLAYKLKKCNKKSMIVTEAKVFHDHAKVTGKAGMAFIYLHYRISEFLVLKKYANINFMEKNIIYSINIMWFFLYSIKHKDARKYLKILTDKYHKIYCGQYENLNDY